MEPMLTTEEVAEGLRVETVTVRRLVARGEVAAYRVGSEYRFRLTDIEQYLARQRIDAGAGDATERSDTLTTCARAALTLAQDEAARLGHAYMGTEHLLLGLIAEGTNIVAKVLDTRGVTLDRARAVVACLGVPPAPADHPGTAPPTPPEPVAREDVRSAPRLRTLVATAAAEAARRGQSGIIAPEHLFLAMLHEGPAGMAGGVLVDLGVDLEQARGQIVQAVWKS